MSRDEEANGSAEPGNQSGRAKKPMFFIVGQSVFSRFHNGSLYPGKIGAAQIFTKTYKVEYDDGDVEDNVPLVRSVAHLTSARYVKLVT